MAEEGSSSMITTFNDLDLTALETIASFLDTDDRRNLALVNKALLAAVRSQWKLFRCNVNLTPEQIPRGIQHWSSLETVLLCNSDYIMQPSTFSANSPFDIFRDEPGEHMPINPKFLTMFQQLNTLISHRPNLKLIVRVDKLVIPEDLDAVLRFTSPTKTPTTTNDTHQQGKKGKEQKKQSPSKEDSKTQRQDGDELTVCYSFLDHIYPHKFTNAPQQMREEFAVLLSANKVPGIVNHMRSPGIGSIDCLTSIFEKHMRIATLTHQQQQPSGSSGSRVPVNKKQAKQEKAPMTDAAKKTSKAILQRAEAIMKSRVGNNIYTGGIDCGWFQCDGSLNDVVIGGAMAWCTHVKEEHMQFKKYKKMDALEVIVRECERGFDLTTAFEQKFLAKMSPSFLPSLRKLVLYSTNNLILIHLTPPAFVMKQITILTVSKSFSFDSFGVFTHLPLLEKLELYMDITNEQIFDHPQDLHALAPLQSLRELTVRFWHVDTQQSIEQLTQVTSLQLLHLGASAAKKVWPRSPMPNLNYVALTDLTYSSAKRYKEDSKFARLALEKSSRLFPNAEVLHLGVLGCGPSTIQSKNDLTARAEMIDRHAVDVLERMNKLKYFQLDTVMMLFNDTLLKKCRTGDMDMSKSIDVEEKHWDRDIQFTSFRTTGLTVIEFHYSLDDDE